MNNLLSYCGLVDPRIRASDKDLPLFGIIVSNLLTISHPFWVFFSSGYVLIKGGIVSRCLVGKKDLLELTVSRAFLTF